MVRLLNNLPLHKKHTKKADRFATIWRLIMMEVLVMVLR
jgi:hypothetical protein